MEKVIDNKRRSFLKTCHIMCIIGLLVASGASNALAETYINSNGIQAQSIVFGVRSVSSSTSVSSTDTSVLCNTGSSSVTVTLPTAVGCSGRQVTVKKTAAGNTVIIAGTSGQTIDGNANYRLFMLNDAVTLVSNGTNWSVLHKKPANVFNAREHGIVGDGVTDDTLPIQALLDHVDSIGGGTVFFPEGTYMISSIILIGDDTTVEGVGKGSIIKAVNNFPNSVNPWVTYGLIRNNDPAAGNHNIVIRDIQVDGNDAGQPDVMPNNGPVLWIMTNDEDILNTNIRIENVLLHDTWTSAANGCMGIVVENSVDVWITGCEVYNSGRDGIDAVGYCDRVHINHNTVHDTQDDGIAVNPSFFYQNDPDIDITNVEVIGNHVYNAGARGIMFGGVIGGVIANNVIDSTTAWGIMVHSDPDGDNSNIVISGNVIKDASQHDSVLNHDAYHNMGGILLKTTANAQFDWERITVSNNIIDNPATSGIEVFAGDATYRFRKLVISGNQIDSAGASGIVFGTDNPASNKNPVDVSVTNNIVRGSTEFGIYTYTPITNLIINSNIVMNSGAAGATKSGIKVYQCANSVITSNLCSDDRVTKYQSYGIESVGITNSIISYNILTGNLNDGLYIDNSPGLVGNNLGVS